MSSNATLLDAYDRWAPDYPPVPHNPLMRAEQAAMLDLWPQVRDRRVLDLACGTGRYAELLAKSDAAAITALDFSAGMLQQVAVSDSWRVRGSMTRLPFVSNAFDVIICGLAVGHTEHLQQWLSETARVLKPGGVLLYSDFHPAAARAGHTRSFKDPQGHVHRLDHFIHDLDIQRQAATAVGLTFDAVKEVRAGYELSEPFTGSEEFYPRWHGMPFVLVVRARKGG